MFTLEEVIPLWFLVEHQIMRDYRVGLGGQWVLSSFTVSGRESKFRTSVCAEGWRKVAQLHF